MLYEVKATKPFDGALRQRWFTDEDFDLTVWFRAPDEMHGFQLAYDKRGAPCESVLTWRNGAGYDLSHVTDNRRISTPILRSGGRRFRDQHLDQFRQHAKQLEPGLKRLIVTLIRNYLRR